MSLNIAMGIIDVYVEVVMHDVHNVLHGACEAVERHHSV